MLHGGVCAHLRPHLSLTPSSSRRQSGPRPAGSECFPSSSQHTCPHQSSSTSASRNRFQSGGEGVSPLLKHLPWLTDSHDRFSLPYRSLWYLLPSLTTHYSLFMDVSLAFLGLWLHDCKPCLDLHMPFFLLCVLTRPSYKDTRQRRYGPWDPV